MAIGDASVATPKAKTKRLAIRDAATLVVVDQSGAVPRILMGQRRADLAFMAGKFVFPGGRVDPADASSPAADDLRRAELDKLLRSMRGRPSVRRARSLALAAIRELREETGLVLGQADNPPLSRIAYFARAITPPERPRRYDTRFFIADCADLTETTFAGDGELTTIAWVTFKEAHALDIPRITRLILADVATFLDGTASPTGIPFYHHRAGKFRRDLI